MARFLFFFTRPLCFVVILGRLHLLLLSCHLSPAAAESVVKGRDFAHPTLYHTNRCYDQSVDYFTEHSMLLTIDGDDLTETQYYDRDCQHVFSTDTYSLTLDADFYARMILSEFEDRYLKNPLPWEDPTRHDRYMPAYVSFRYESTDCSGEPVVVSYVRIREEFFYCQDRFVNSYKVFCSRNVFTEAYYATRDCTGDPTNVTTYPTECNQQQDRGFVDPLHRTTRCLKHGKPTFFTIERIVGAVFLGAFFLTYFAYLIQCLCCCFHCWVVYRGKGGDYETLSGDSVGMEISGKRVLILLLTLCCACLCLVLGIVFAVAVRFG